MKTWLNKKIEKCLGNGEVRIAPEFRVVQIIKRHRNGDVTISVDFDVSRPPSLVNWKATRWIRIAEDWLTSSP